MKNIIHFVSLGAGDPDLITIKALKCLQKAEVVFCPTTINKEGKAVSRSLSIVQELCIEQNKICCYNVPMEKDRTIVEQKYTDITDEIIKLWKSKNQSIAICVQGDSCFYSSTFYISEILTSQNIPIEHIAGVPAFIAGGNLANIHIVKQKEKLHVIPSVVLYNELLDYCKKEGDTVVIMKTSQSESVIKDFIRSVNNLTFHYFENIGVECEYYTTNKEDILQREFPYFSLIIIKK